ncbi:MAG: hypothetical protein EKK68_09915 [Candidatus Competibacteraceae bacterium]|nr:MAG: hypothetical protein EKK68_09915 [Candidatus Competibacteraceae bacterium]
MTEPILRTVIAPIQAGQLKITIQSEELPLENCMTYATRQNPRRLYLFVSKVLGKHWPVRPHIMRDIHRRLAAKIANLPGPLLVIGLAETATALGRGVAEEAALLTGRNDILYLQTTRYHLDRPLAFGFNEAHSHAPEHIVYLPDPALRPLFNAAQSLILVDDEISTGRTLTELAKASLETNPGIEQIVLISITNWLTTVLQEELIKQLERPLSFLALVQGSFQFEPDPTFPPPVLPLVIANSNRNHDHILADPARTGLIAGHEANQTRILAMIPTIETDKPLAVIGTGEYAYKPFRIALALEEAGYDVLFQTTTRSPILMGDAIASQRQFMDNYGDDIPNYLYNLDTDRLPIVIYEHLAMLDKHPLASSLSGVAFCGEA